MRHSRCKLFALLATAQVFNVHAAACRGENTAATTSFPDGEDPELIGLLGAAAVRGMQRGNLRDPLAVLACAKHVVGDGGTTAEVKRVHLQGEEEECERQFSRAAAAAFGRGREPTDVDNGRSQAPTGRQRGRAHRLLPTALPPRWGFRWIASPLPWAHAHG